MKPVARTYQVSVMPNPAHNARSKLCVERINVQLWKTQTTLNTTLWDVLNAPRSSFLPFPPTVDSSMKNDGCKSFLFHFDLCLLLWSFWKVFLGISKGKQASKCKRKKKKKAFKTRAGNQIITLTSNFGIKCFGHTILSLWCWLFSTKHPVIKGRLVVGLFFFSI